MCFTIQYTLKYNHHAHACIIDIHIQQSDLVAFALEFIAFVLVIAWIAVKFGINITSVVLEMGINFTRRSRVKFTISNTTRVVFIPNFTATHAIPS